MAPAGLDGLELAGTDATGMGRAHVEAREEGEVVPLPPRRPTSGPDDVFAVPPCRRLSFSAMDRASGASDAAAFVPEVEPPVLGAFALVESDAGESDAGGGRHGLFRTSGRGKGAGWGRDGRR
jgi:hypothetical protein